jgi:hypothetical protein
MGLRHGAEIWRDAVKGFNQLGASLGEVCGRHGNPFALRSGKQNLHEVHGGSSLQGEMAYRDDAARFAVGGVRFGDDPRDGTSSSSFLSAGCAAWAAS